MNGARESQKGRACIGRISLWLSEGRWSKWCADCGDVSRGKEDFAGMRVLIDFRQSVVGLDLLAQGDGSAEAKETTKAKAGQTSKTIG